ncbi:hypothetical protein OPV22_000092 [Ensete ventricosum]|uniref:Uncharacterized protein n=1 Tax=Ensete ventricosum TaxID=4639 RepID=A0AAV8RR33_ENSVE|nr:hypothetical protein OPV22_000092 [Ensete ventricosum]
MDWNPNLARPCSLVRRQKESWKKTESAELWDWVTNWNISIGPGPGPGSGLNWIRISKILFHLREGRRGTAKRGPGCDPVADGVEEEGAQGLRSRARGTDFLYVVFNFVFAAFAGNRVTLCRWLIEGSGGVRVLIMVLRAHVGEKCYEIMKSQNLLLLSRMPR